MKKCIAAWCLAAIGSLLFVDTMAQEKRTDYTDKKRKDQATSKEQQFNTEQKTPVKIIQFIPGSWTLDQVIRGGKDISEHDTVAQYQTLEFNREGRYVSYAGNEKIDSGAYRLNEDHAILYMASETDDKAHEWYVWFSEDGTMTLKHHDGVAHGEKFLYVYKRTSNAARK
jgi:hypothetical protein